MLVAGAGALAAMTIAGEGGILRASGAMGLAALPAPGDQGGETFPSSTTAIAGMRISTRIRSAR